MIGAPMHPHAAARGYSRPAPDPIVAPAQSSREGSAGIRVRARNARLTQGTGACGNCRSRANGNGGLRPTFS